MRHRRPYLEEVIVVLLLTVVILLAAGVGKAHSALHREDAVTSARSVTVQTFAGFTEHPPYVTARCRVVSVHRARCRAYYAGDRIAARVRVTVVDEPGGDVGYLSGLHVIRNGPRAGAARRVKWTTSTASVYDVNTGNAPACGWRYANVRRMVAHRSLPCGTKVRFMYGGRKVDAVVGDRGPFVRGRTWDLTTTLASDLGSCVCLPTVRWRLLP